LRLRSEIELLTVGHLSRQLGVNAPAPEGEAAHHDNSTAGSVGSAFAAFLTVTVTPFGPILFGLAETPFHDRK
jgi:hypothetical protein